MFENYKIGKSAAKELNEFKVQRLKGQMYETKKKIYKGIQNMEGFKG